MQDADLLLVQMLLLNHRPLITGAARYAAESILTRLSECAQLRGQVDQYLDTPPVAVEHVKTVHVLQGECAIVETFQEPTPVCICSTGATTCCIVAFNCRLSGRCGIIHYDQPRAEQARCLAPLLQGMVEPDLYIVGGFTEATGCGVKVANSLLSSLEDTDLPVHIRLACVGPLNTTADGEPRCCSLALKAEKGQVCVSSCLDQVDKGPQAVQRLARLWMRSAPQVEEVYDTFKQTLKVTGLGLALTQQQAHTYNALLRVPDAQFLSFVSTSPQHESALFVPGDILFGRECGTFVLPLLTYHQRCLQRHGQCSNGC